MTRYTRIVRNATATVRRRSFFLFVFVTTCSSLLPQDSTQPKPATREPATRSCAISLWQAPSGGDPVQSWNSDTTYTQGGSEKSSSLYLTGDRIVVSPEIIPSMFRERTADNPNSLLKTMTLDGREVVIDGPIYLDSTLIRIYAQSVRFTSRGTITLSAGPPQAVKDSDGVDISARTVTVDAGNEHPLNFLTSDPAWTSRGRRIVKVTAETIQGRPAKNARAQLVSMTLDSEFPQLLTQQPSPDPYQPLTGRAAGADYERAMVSMLWPEQFADKVAREFALGPFDAKRTASLLDRASAFKSQFLRTQHVTAASTLDGVVSAITQGVDELGFHKYYIPRTSFKYEQTEFGAQADRLLGPQTSPGQSPGQIQSWDNLLIAIKKKSSALDTNAIDDTRAKSIAAQEEMRRSQDDIDKAMDRSVGIAGELQNAAAAIQQREQAIDSLRIDADARAKDKNNILIVGRVAAAAAGLAVGGPAGLAVGAGLDLTSRGVANSSTGQPLSAQALLTQVPDVLQETKSIQDSAKAAAKDWKDVKDGWDAYKKSRDKVTDNMSADDAKKASADRDQQWSKFQDKLNTFYGNTKKLAGEVSGQPPQAVSGDDFEAKDNALQDALRQRAALLQEKSQLNDTIKSATASLEGAKDKVAEVALKEEFLRRANVQNDQDNSRLEALAWALRQRHIRDLASNTAILLRAYKYHTGRDVDSPINSTYFSTYYRLQRPSNAAGAAREADVLSSGDPVAFEQALNTQRSNLSREIREVQAAVAQGYDDWLRGAKQQGQQPITLTFVGGPALDIKPTELSEEQAFLAAVNKEIERQAIEVRSGQNLVWPLYIKIPRGLTAYPAEQPQRLFDAEIHPVFEDGTSLDGEVIQFGLIHPLTGIVFYKNDCSTVDFRKATDKADVQPYWTTCDNKTECVHDPYSINDLVPLPLYAPYSLQIRVPTSRVGASSIPRVKSILITFRYLE